MRWQVFSSLAPLRTPKSASGPRNNSFRPDSPLTTTSNRGQKTQPAPSPHRTWSVPDASSSPQLNPYFIMVCSNTLRSQIYPARYTHRTFDSFLKFLFSHLHYVLKPPIIMKEPLFIQSKISCCSLPSTSDFGYLKGDAYVFCKQRNRKYRSMCKSCR